MFTISERSEGEEVEIVGEDAKSVVVRRGFIRIDNFIPEKQNTKQIFHENNDNVFLRNARSTGKY